MFGVTASRSIDHATRGHNTIGLRTISHWRLQSRNERRSHHSSVI